MLYWPKNDAPQHNDKLLWSKSMRFIFHPTTESFNMEAVTEIMWIVAYPAGDLNRAAL